MTKEEKDKLIALSDLNRKDNIKYISSEAQGIAITLDSDRYAPTFCKLERAYICGRRKSEEQIADLEEKLANADYQLEGRDLEIKELKAQIEKMKCCGNCKNEGDYKEPYRYGTGWCNICKRHKVAKGNFDKWEIKEK